MDRRFLNHTTHLLHQFHHCRKQRLGERAGELGDRTATAGLAVVMNALRLCKHVSAYGLGEKINAFTKKHFHVGTPGPASLPCPEPFAPNGMPTPSSCLFQHSRNLLTGGIS